MQHLEIDQKLVPYTPGLFAQWARHMPQLRHLAVSVVGAIPDEDWWAWRNLLHLSLYQFAWTHAPEAKRTSDMKITPLRDSTLARLATHNPQLQTLLLGLDDTQVQHVPPLRLPHLTQFHVTMATDRVGTTQVEQLCHSCPSLQRVYFRVEPMREPTPPPTYSMEQRVTFVRRLFRLPDSVRTLEDVRAVPFHTVELLSLFVAAKDGFPTYLDAGRWSLVDMVERWFPALQLDTRETAPPSARETTGAQYEHPPTPIIGGRKVVPVHPKTPAGDAEKQPWTREIVDQELAYLERVRQVRTERHTFEMDLRRRGNGLWLGAPDRSSSKQHAREWVRRLQDRHEPSWLVTETGETGLDIRFAGHRVRTVEVSVAQPTGPRWQTLGQLHDWHASLVRLFARTLRWPLSRVWVTML